MKLDRETQELLSKSEKVNEFVKSDGWRHVKNMLVEYLVDLRDINTIESKSVSDVRAELAARQIAFNMLIDWLRSVEGVRNSHKYHQEMLNNIKDKEQQYILNLEGGSGAEE